MEARQEALFSVGDEYRQMLTLLYAGLQQTELWDKASGSCFCIAGFLVRAITDLNRRARLLPCYAIAIRNDHGFLLGYRNVVAAPGQVDGHLVCLVDEKILVDFGLKNVQRYGWREFPSAVACEVSSSNVFPAELRLDERRKIVWCNDCVNSATDAVMTDHEPAIKSLYNEYKAAVSRRRMNQRPLERNARSDGGAADLKR